MFGRKRKRSERLPWYRQRGYKGKLTESEKRGLDAFREQPTHPATRLGDLPEDVQAYINRLEFDLHDKKEETVVFAGAAALFVGVAALYAYFVGLPKPSGWTLAVGSFGIAYAIYLYAFEFRKNQDDFLPAHDPSSDRTSTTDEAIRQEWELEYIVNTKLRDD
jgi:hypothetical protein